ncbi:MAG: hypothetical protein EOP48_10745 [Sphingobacteriales bacterium]|nr:MAG: hypothetical protein EOP48_10745 [Sphingobacteriales bacterium]
MMTYNITAYLFYIILMVFIIVIVGKAFHRNGRVFILSLFRNNSELTDTVNNLLLVAYYLFNIGYAFVTLRYWDTILTLPMLVESLAVNMGLLILILATTHYCNMLGIWILSKRNTRDQASVDAPST